jgi:hypothetical protein
MRPGAVRLRRIGLERIQADRELIAIMQSAAAQSESVILQLREWERKWKMNRPMTIQGLVAKLRCLPLLALAAAAGPALAEFQELTTFEPGSACQFALKVESDGSGTRVNKEPPYGRWGSISAGTGSDLRLTNLSNNSSITLQGNGAVTLTRRASENGSVIQTLTGHNIVFLFPTDTPPGPSTTLYIGSVTIRVDSLGNFTVLSSSGRKRDLCAELSR